MKRFVLLILLLAMALSMTGCLTVTGGNDQPDELPPEEQHLTADVDETEVWHRRHDDVWSGQDEPELVSRDFERISGAAANGMTVGQELLLLDFMDCYYQSIGQLRVIDPADLFAEPKEVAYHKTIWHDLCVIRKLSPIDLTMTSYSYALRCESITPSEETEGDVDMVLRESNVTYFAGLNGIPSEQFGIKHTFTLRGVGDRWLIVRHWSDDNAYYSADYDEETQQDRNFPAITDYIQARRELPRDEQTVSATAAHPYDRAAARQAVKPRRLQPQQRLAHREPRLPREMLDLRRRERMNHDRRELPLDRAQHLLVVRQPEIRVQAALDHHLRAACLDRLAHLREDLLRRQEIRILRPLPPEKRAEPALIHTDIRIIDIPVDEERHRIAEPLTTHRVRRPSERQEIALPQEPRPLCRR